MYNSKCVILRQEEVIPGCRLLCLDAPEIALAAVPGQFLHVRCGDSQDPLLRRPVSIHFADRERGRIYLLYRVAGRGTALLAGLKAGERVDLLGPLGRGYTLPESTERAAIVGGGIGAAPLFFLLGEMGKIYGPDITKVSVFLGAATAGAVPGAGWLRGRGLPLYIATDDGTSGFKGTVVDLFREAACDEPFRRVYACGPQPMIRGLAGVVGPGALVEVSVEERMGCGVGACLSCACRVRAGDGVKNAHVCIDGPVFNLRDLVL